jgi:hypothetical protein
LDPPTGIPAAVLTVTRRLADADWPNAETQARITMLEMNQQAGTVVNREDTL